MTCHAYRATSSLYPSPSQDSVSLSFLPWAHIYGQTVELYAMMSSGAAQGLAESPKTLLDDIKQVSPTVLVAVPTVYNKVYDAVKLKVSKSSSAKAAVYHQAMKVAEERRRWGWCMLAP